MHLCSCSFVVFFKAVLFFKTGWFILYKVFILICLIVYELAMCSSGDGRVDRFVVN